MNNDQVKEIIKGHLEDYAKETGRPTSKKLFNCFIPTHDDTNASMQYNSTYYKCYGACNRTYDIFSLYAMDHGLDEVKDFKQIKEELARKYNIDLKRPSSYKVEKKLEEPKKKNKANYSEYYNECYKNVSKTNYFKNRGLTEEIINKYKLGYDLKSKYVVLPISKGFYITRDTMDYTEEERKANNRLRYNIPKDASIELFNLNYIKEADFKSVIFITEAVIDALSLEVVEPTIKAIALQGIGNANRLIEELEKEDYKGYIVLALDNDESGIKTSKNLEAELEKIGIRTKTLNRVDATKEEIYKGYKDINEYLVNDKESLEKEIKIYNDTLKQALINEARKLLDQENALNYLDAFIETTQDAEARSPIATGIGKLDYALNGGLYKGNLIILGAISGLGKTTLALQIADNIARNNKDVLLFSLEMSRDELIAKSLSRYMFLNEKLERGTTASLENILSHREILNGTMYKDNISEKIQENLKEAYKTYRDEIAPNVYINECKETMEITLEEIEKRIKKQIDITEEKPVVIIDYLQIIENKERGLTDIQATGKIVKNLKRIARKYKIAIIVISAFNRGAIYSDTDYTSFRDTSTIEYTADVLLTLQYSVLNDANLVEEKQSDSKQAKKVKNEVKEASEKDPTELTLKILKNRNGKRKNIEKIYFYGKANYLDFRDYDIN